MKVSNGHFPHPATGEIIRPGEIYMDFSEKEHMAAGRSIALLAGQAAKKNADSYEGFEMPKKSVLNEVGCIAEKEGGTKIDDGKTLREYTVAALKSIAEEKGVEGYASMKKADLVAALESLNAGGTDDTREACADTASSGE